MEILSISSRAPSLSPGISRPNTTTTRSSSLHLSIPSTSSSRSLNKTPSLTISRTRPGYTTRNRFTVKSLFGLGVPELAVIAGVTALVFGPKQLPEIGKTLGKTIKSFQQAAKEFESELKKPEEADASESTTEAKTTSDNAPDKENVSVSSSKES